VNNTNTLMLTYIALGRVDGPWDDFFFDGSERPNATITLGDEVSIKVDPDDGWFNITVTDFSENDIKSVLAEANGVSVDDIEIVFSDIIISI